MSDETAVNLEDDGPETVPSPAPAEPETVAAEATPEGETPPDVEVEGQKFVPLPALIKEREKAARETAELRQQLEYLTAQQQAQQPFIDFLKQNPHLTQPRPEPAAKAEDDPRAVEMAQRLALFRPDGSLDVDAGARTLGLMRTVAEETTQRYVAPIQQVTEQTKSAENYHRVLAQAKTKAGRTPNPAALQTLWQSLPPALTADPQTANLLGILAFGMEAVSQGETPTAPPPVVPTEGSGGLPQSRPAVSALGAKIAADRGRTEKQWAENSKGFRPSRSSVLED